jgi:hypothetical protein
VNGTVARPGRPRVRRLSESVERPGLAPAADRLRLVGRIISAASVTAPVLQSVERLGAPFRWMPAGAGVGGLVVELAAARFRTRNADAVDEPAGHLARALPMPPRAPAVVSGSPSSSPTSSRSIEVTSDSLFTPEFFRRSTSRETTCESGHFAALSCSGGP